VSNELIQSVEAVYYPSTDDEPMAENEAHLTAMLLLIMILREYYRERSDVYVNGNMFWYYEEGDKTKRRAPDLMVVKGVDPGPPNGRRYFQSWVEAATPCFVLELASESTFREDLNAKKNLYRDLGVSEYFLFDPLREWLDAPLIGFRLMTDVNEDEELVSEYEDRTAQPDGSMFSQELGLWLRPEGPRLRLIDPLTRLPLRDMSESSDRVRALEVETRQKDEAIRLSEQRTEAERQRAEAERQRAEAERQRANEMAEELARLRAAMGVAERPKSSSET